MADVKELNVTLLPPREKHPTIFQTFAELKKDESFILINDHDPRPLRNQFMYEHADEFAWEYVEEGPEWWRVRISKTK